MLLKKITIVLCYIFFSSMLWPDVGGHHPEKIIFEIRKQYRLDIDDLTLAFIKLSDQARKMEPGSIEKLQRAHLNARHAFKTVELFIEYFDPEAVKYYVNGAPLPTQEQNIAEVIIFDPCGLQTLDELIFSDDPFAEREEIARLADKLVTDFKDIADYQKTIKIQHRHVFEAMREELVRIFTLGVTGFDTPGSVNALPEAHTALQSVAEIFERYAKRLAENDPVLAGQIQKHLAGALDHLGAHPDFDSFDRMHFLKKWVNPLYDLLLDAHLALGIETVEEAVVIPTAQNYFARNIFGQDFLDPYYYADINAVDLTSERTELGKILFFDPVLSSTNTMSCASCHQPDKAFTDGKKKSLASDGKNTLLRNAMTLVNAVYAEDYFYDLREATLERQIKHVVFAHDEFNTDFESIESKISTSAEYQKLFQEAYPEYPDYAISKWSISHSLACYVASLNALNSPVDRYIRGETDEIDPAVVRGFNLFMGKAACGTCHFAPTFNGSVPPQYEESESEVLGVPATTDTLDPRLDPDPGRIASFRPEDEAGHYRFSFKTPTVRNIALTAPYMHNGVYETLEEVMDFYNKGGGLGLGMDVPHQTLPDAPLNLTDPEIDDLIAFMESLTDISGLDTALVRLPAYPVDHPLHQRRLGGDYR